MLAWSVDGCVEAVQDSGLSSARSFRPVFPVFFFIYSKDSINVFNDIFYFGGHSPFNRFKKVFELLEFSFLAYRRNKKDIFK